MKVFCYTARMQLCWSTSVFGIPRITQTLDSHTHTFDLHTVSHNKEYMKRFDSVIFHTLPLFLTSHSAYIIGLTALSLFSRKQANRFIDFPAFASPKKKGGGEGLMALLKGRKLKEAKKERRIKQSCNVQVVSLLI